MTNHDTTPKHTTRNGNNKKHGVITTTHPTGIFYGLLTHPAEIMEQEELQQELLLTKNPKALDNDLDFVEIYKHTHLLLPPTISNTNLLISTWKNNNDTKNHAIIEWKFTDNYFKTHT